MYKTLKNTNFIFKIKRNTLDSGKLKYFEYQSLILPLFSENSI